MFGAESDDTESKSRAPERWVVDPTTRPAHDPRDAVDPVYRFRRRAAGFGADLTAPVVCSGITVDLDRYEVTVGGRPVRLTPRQVEVLALFVAAPNRLWTRQEIAWVTDTHARSARAIDTLLVRLRHRIGERLWKVVPGRGWHFDP
jgi:DNA-binding response OmpR family regulator